MEASIRPVSVVVPMARTRLVAMENTHNLSGGRVFPQTDVVAICQRAHDRGLRVHMDGARIWNAAVAQSKTPAEILEPVDTVSACFSKGLGAPVGSVIAGSKDVMAEARRYRRMLGGGMRQVGVLCAAALYALEHHLARLPEDHDNARLLAEGVSSAAGLLCQVDSVQTNIVNFDVERGTAQDFVKRASDAGVLLNAIGPQSIRAVTHLDVSRSDVTQAIALLARAAEG
jgi:threonine aldolase